MVACWDEEGEVLLDRLCNVRCRPKFQFTSECLPDKEIHVTDALSPRDHAHVGWRAAR